MDPESVLWEETVEPGASWSHVLKRGTILRITDVEGGANVGALFYNFECTAERFNMPDTLKAQHIARLTEASCSTPTWGASSAPSPRDTVGWHDPLGGCSNAALVAREVRRGVAIRSIATPATSTAATASLSKWASGVSARAT